MAPDRQFKHTSADFTGSVFLISGDGRMLSLPIPSDSPRDPLSWPKWKRIRAGLVLLYLSVVATLSIQAPEMMFKSLSRDFPPPKTGPFTLPTLLTAPTLMLGVGSLIWIPLSLAIGRRLVVLIAALLLTIATTWAAAAPNFYHLLAAVCLEGLAGGVVFSVMLLIIIDMTFIHERPRCISSFWCFGSVILLALLAFVPHAADSETNWRRFYWVWTVAAGISVLLIAFVLPETYFERPPVAYDGRILVQSSTEKVRIYEDWRDVLGGKGGSLTRSGGGWRAFFTAYPQVLLCLCNPLLFWTMLLNAANFGGMMSIGTTFPMVLRSPPYNLPPVAIPLVNAAAAFGSLAAYPATGPLITNITRRLALRNAGVRDAEHYLPAFILPILSGAFSCALYGLTVQNGWHFSLIYVSYAFNSFSYSSMGAAITLWVTEAFPRWAAAALVAVGGTGYLASFGMSFAIGPWVKSQGFAGANLEIAAVILVIGAVAVPVSFWGQGLRQFIHGRWGDFEAGALRPQRDAC